LKAQDLYDDSIIILTSDHGDSLGAEGRWGHQFFLFPEDVRIPLIVSLPKSQRSALTTDLGRVSFLTDITPTLLSLLGQPVPDLGPLFGSPLFVPANQEPAPRRRESFLVMSSYGSTYGLLRRNGRSLYISDLLNWREYAYTLRRDPLGERETVSESVRRLSQAGILGHVRQVEDLYRRR
jgi:phosphoglycerol transferase MdoB-like AlkP superfamily enzyme